MSDHGYQGPPADSAASTSFKWWLWGPLGVVAAVLLFGAIGANSPEGKEKQMKRDIIARCWDDQGKKSLEPSLQRYVAKMCENFEDEFTRKYGHRP